MLAVLPVLNFVEAEVIWVHRALLASSASLSLMSGLAQTCPSLGRGCLIRRHSL